MNVTVDDLYNEIGKLTVTLRKREEQVAALEAENARIREELGTLTGKGSEKSPTT